MRDGSIAANAEWVFVFRPRADGERARHNLMLGTIHVQYILYMYSNAVLCVNTLHKIKETDAGTDDDGRCARYSRQHVVWLMCAAHRAKLCWE